MNKKAMLILLALVGGCFAAQFEVGYEPKNVDTYTQWGSLIQQEIPEGDVLAARGDCMINVESGDSDDESVADDSESGERQRRRSWPLRVVCGTYDGVCFVYERWSNTKSGVSGPLLYFVVNSLVYSLIWCLNTYHVGE